MEKKDGWDGIIKVKNLSYSIGKTKILKNINLEIPKGKITVIIGPSGSGKSTLLQIMGGLLEPTEGEVIVNGTSLFSLKYEDRFQFRKNNIGIVFQELGLFDWMTVEENIMFPLRIHTSLKKERLKSIVQKIIEELHLKGSEKLYPDQLSGGMQRRVALGRILALNPEIILLDEPTSGLDPVIAATVEDLLKDINRKMGKTLVVISHIIETTLNISNFIGVIFKGELVGFGNKEEIVNSTHPVIKQYFSRSAQGPITEGI